MGEKLYHWGIISSILSDNLTPFYETVDNNQKINFVTADGTQRSINSLTIWSSASDLYIDMNSSGYCVYVPANTAVSLDYLQLSNMIVLGNSGQKIRYVALYY